MKLRPRAHQRAAIASLTRELTHASRATLVAACGTGKTLVAARTAQTVAGTGRTLVLVPTLDLVAQTARAWRDAGRQGAVIAVCSADEILRHDHDADRDAEITTDPALVARLVRAAGHADVFATYASLPVLAAAHRDHALEAWDLVVVDEAHRTAGRTGKPWGAVHHDAVIPARRRLYQTATPRVWVGDGADAVTTMDDVQVFGRVAYRLGFGEAIKLGLLADYRVLVPVVSDDDVRALLGRDDIDGEAARISALQIAVLRAMDSLFLRRVVTYHSRVRNARALAETMPDLAQRTQILPDVAAQWVSGKQSYWIRTDRIHRFTTSTSPSVLANARVFGEGVDVPAIDAVAFADPKGSAIDTIQAVGRAVRQAPGASKTATIIVPVYTPPTLDAEAIIDSSDYAPLWQVLRALRAHDERLASRLRPYVSESGNAASSYVPGAAMEWLRTLGEAAPDPQALALAIDLRAVAPKSLEWRKGYAAAKRFHLAHGHLVVEQAHVDATGFRLGAWVSWQRHLYQLRQHPPVRTAALDALGMVWNTRVDQWERGYAHARAFAAEHGHLAIPIRYQHDGFNLGQWLHNIRHRTTIAPERAAALHQLDPDWTAPYSLEWHRAYQDARAFATEHGHLNVPRTKVGASGRRLGEWVYAQRQQRDDLTSDQIARLDALGMDWAAVSPHQARWSAGYDAASAFHREHGHLRVPGLYKAPDGFGLGSWVARQRKLRRLGKLTPPQITALTGLGIDWTPPPGPQRGPSQN